MAEPYDHPLVKHAKIARAVLVARARAGLIHNKQANSMDLPHLDTLLTRLADVHPRSALVVTMRFFGGNTDAEIATALNIAVRTVKRDWHVARAWLASEYGGSDPLGIRVPVVNGPKNPSSHAHAEQER